jgi:hypothetical protein
MKPTNHGAGWKALGPEFSPKAGQPLETRAVAVPQEALPALATQLVRDALECVRR